MNAKQIARWTSVALAGLSVAFAIVSFTTRWDWLRHDDMVEKVAARFDLSYTKDASLPVQLDDPEWVPLLRLIKQYSPHEGELPNDRRPMTFARAPAITSAQTPFGEWTAPSTPVVLFYRKWPDPGTGDFKWGQDGFIVGTIGDLHDWVRRDRADFDFFGGPSFLDCCPPVWASPLRSPTLPSALAQPRYD